MLNKIIENTDKKEDGDKEANICCMVVPHSGESDSVNSKAVIKFQTVQSPANFAQLQCNTDLKLPPSNWLMNSMNVYGLSQALTHSYGFTSFRMAHMFPDCVGGVDVVSNAENIKKLLKLPYSPKCTISLMVHQIENTLLIDEFDIYRYLLYQADTDWPWLKSFFVQQNVSRVNKFPIEYSIKNKTREALQKKNLWSKFLYHSLPDADDNNSKSAECEIALSLDSLNRNVNKLRVVHLMNGNDPDLPEPDLDQNVPDAQSNHMHNRNVMWTFEDIRMLIGTDMLIFGSDTHPCISLRLRDMSEPINVLTGIDYWLDNLMCNVPEVVMCYHLDGLVQKYEIIKTEDLPNLVDSNFSPQAIRNVAQHILAFLKQKATKSGHTYWLFKGRNDDFVKLYDLTSLSMNQEENKHSATSDKEQINNDNPFTVPVAMLLYKVAKNIKNMNTNMSLKQAGTVKALLDNCIKLLAKEKYPQIVTSSHYILSDLHIPTGLDPNTANNQFSSVDSDIQSVYDDEKYQTDYSNNDHNNCDMAGSDDAYLIDKLTDTISMKSIRDGFNEMDKNWKHNQSPPPITVDVEERCHIALEHIAHGFECLQYFAFNEEKQTQDKEEMAKQQEKQQIIFEEQNPIMAKSNQAIPMDYTALNPIPDLSKSNEAIPMGWKNDACDLTNIKANITNEVQEKKLKKNRKKSKKHRASENEQDNENSLNRSLDVEDKIEAIVTWNVHLKLLLLEKACLVYEVLAKHCYQLGKYGKAMKYIFNAIKCQKIVSKHMTAAKLFETDFQLEVAGDCYYQLSWHFTTIQSQLNDFKDESEIEKLIGQQISKEISDDNDGDGHMFLPEPNENIEFLMVTSYTCYERALKLKLSNERRRQLKGRLGYVHNDLAAKYLVWTEEELGRYKEDMVKTIPDTIPLYLLLIKRSFDSIIEGISAFKEIGDNTNQAIVYCTLGRFWRIRAYVAFKKSDIVMVKKCYEDSFASYQKAFSIMCDKKENPQLWDVITWELTTSKLSLAQLLSKHSIIKFEQTIIDLLLNTLKTCDHSKEIKYLVRVGTIYDQLATIYRNGFAREVNESRKKNLFQLTRKYYDKATKIYDEVESPKLSLEVLTNRMDFQNELSNSGQNVTIKMKQLQIGLQIAQKGLSIFDKILRDDTLDDDMLDLLEKFEEYLQNFLKSMVKLSLGKAFSDKERQLTKQLFGFSLRPKAKLNVELLTIHLRDLLGKIAAECATSSFLISDNT